MVGSYTSSLPLMPCIVADLRDSAAYVMSEDTSCVESPVGEMQHDDRAPCFAGSFMVSDL